jgi:hypothetical protein
MHYITKLTKQTLVGMVFFSRFLLWHVDGDNFLEISVEASNVKLANNRNVLTSNCPQD